MNIPELLSTASRVIVSARTFTAEERAFNDALFNNLLDAAKEVRLMEAELQVLRAKVEAYGGLGW